VERKIWISRKVSEVKNIYLRQLLFSRIRSLMLDAIQPVRLFRKAYRRFSAILGFPDATLTLTLSRKRYNEHLISIKSESNAFWTQNL